LRNSLCRSSANFPSRAMFPPLQGVLGQGTHAKHLAGDFVDAKAGSSDLLVKLCGNGYGTFE
jgi:hypothetical protein